MRSNIDEGPKWLVEYDGKTIVLRTVHGAITLKCESAKTLGETLIAISKSNQSAIQIEGARL